MLSCSQVHGYTGTQVYRYTMSNQRNQTSCDEAGYYKALASEALTM